MADEINKNTNNKPETTGANWRDDKGKFVEGHPGLGGRPEGSKVSIVAILKEELDKFVQTSDNSEKVSYARALVKKMLKKAIIEEDVQMIKDIVNRVDGMPKQSFGFDTDDLLNEVKIDIKSKRDDNQLKEENVPERE